MPARSGIQGERRGTKRIYKRSGATTRAQITVTVRHDGEMDLDSVADELYGTSPEEFVERRTQRVAEARATKDRALVKAVTGLRRPTRSAWLVNLLAREAPEDVAALLQLGAALGEAQRRGSGADLRRLSSQRHSALETLVRQALALGARRGHVATEATRQEVTQTLQAALSDPGVAELVTAGRVVQPASYGGFGPLDLLAAMTPVAAGTEVPPDEAPDGQESGAEDSRARDADAQVGDAQVADAQVSEVRRQAEAVVQAAKQSLEAARERVRVTAETATVETSRADELAEHVDALRVQLQEAEAAERLAQEAARAARKQRAQAQEELAEAESTLAAAAEALAALASP